MNHRFALGTIITYLDSLPFVIEKDSIMYKATESLIDMVEKEEKYKWHDLRKNPNDLPKDGLDIVVWNSGADKFSMTASPYWVRNCAKDSGYNIVAWKEIEPFESEV